MPSTSSGSSTSTAATRAPSAGRQRDDIRQIVLPLRVVVAQTGDPAAQVTGGRDHDSGIGFADEALLLRRVGVLDDAGNAAVRAAQDTPVTDGVGQRRGQQYELRRIHVRAELAQRFAAKQRHVTE